MLRRSWSGGENDRAPGLANAELEDGQVDSGYNRNVVCAVSFIYVEGDQPYASLEDEHLPLHMMCTPSLQYRRMSRVGACWPPPNCRTRLYSVEVNVSVSAQPSPPITFKFIHIRLKEAARDR